MKPFGICTASLRFLTVVLPLTQLSSADPAMQLLDSGLTGGGTASANIGNGEVMTLASETGRGDVAAIASVANVVMYPGRLGQIYEISEASLAITSVAERSQVLVIPSFIMTDSTTVADPLAVIVWNPSSGPADMLEDGSVKTGAVYQDTPVTLEGRLSGIGFILGLLIQETIGDNFGIYGSDGIDDAWQVEFFGIDNPDGRATQDPDGDGHNNAFEFTAGLIPTNPLSRFQLSIAPVSSQPWQKNISFGPMMSGRSYVVKTSHDLSSGSWTTLFGSSISDNGNHRTVTDTSASGPKKFYKVEIVKP